MCKEINEYLLQVGSAVSDLIYFDEGFKKVVEKNIKNAWNEVFVKWLFSMYEATMIITICSLLEINDNGINLQKLLNKIQSGSSISKDKKNDIPKDLESIKDEFNKFKEIRDKRLAHHDKNFQSSKITIRHDNFDEAIKLITELLNKYHGFIIGGKQTFITDYVTAEFEKVSIICESE